MIQLRWVTRIRSVQVSDDTFLEEEYKVLQYREYSDGWLDWRDVSEETEDETGVMR